MPPCSTQISDVLKNPKYIKNDKSMDSPEISLSYQDNIADETISSMDVKSFDNKVTGCLYHSGTVRHSTVK